MSLLSDQGLSEQQKVADLERQVRLAKDKLDKKLTKQKILLGAFFVEILSSDENERLNLDALKKYTASELPNFLTRQFDKDLMAGFIEKLGGQTEEEPILEDTTQASITYNNNDTGGYYHDR